MSLPQPAQTSIAVLPAQETNITKPFRLLRYFSLASLGAILVVTGILAVVYERLSVADLVRSQESHHVALTQVAANTLWPKFSRFILASSELDASALQSHPQTAALKQAVLEELTGTRVLKVKVYDASGRTAFSTEAKQIGEDKSKNAGFISARAGQAASELVHRNQFSAFEQVVENVDVVSSYIPLREPSKKDIQAVFEIYSDISPLLRRIHDTRNAVVLWVCAILLGLYLVLFFIVRHADATIKQQHRQLVQDQQALYEAHGEIKRSEQFHRALIESSSDAVVILNTELCVNYATSVYESVFGRPRAGAIQRPFTDCAREEYREPIKSWLSRVSGSGEAEPSFEFEGIHPIKGTRFYAAAATNLLRDPAVLGIVVNVRDITERKNAEIQVRRLALYDELTGLARRDLFAEQARKAIAYAKRHGEPLAILFLDLDGFKRINDTRGHAAGDTLLRVVANRMRETMRESDTIGRYLMRADDHVARFGGDEFMLLLTRVYQPGDAVSAARRLLDALAQPYKMRDGSDETITASIGIAMFPLHGQDIDTLMKRADAAMYAAKLHGKNSYQLASEA